MSEAAPGRPATLPSWRLEQTALAAHRGGAGEAPENTVLAMVHGLASGATHLEIDVRATADGTPVCIHDASAARTCGVDVVVEELTLDEVRELDPCTLWSEHKGVATGEREPPTDIPAACYRVPTLDEVLSNVPGVPVLMDLKPSAPAAGIARAVKRWSRTGDILLAGYDDDVLDDVAAKLPDVPRGAGLQGTRAFFEEGSTDADAIIVPTEHDGLGLVDQGFVHAAHESGAGFWVWTINDVAAARELMSLGVDGIITDAPATLAPERARLFA